MDPLPQILPSEEPNDTTTILRDAFEEQFEKEKIPQDIINNLNTYTIDNIRLKEAANNASLVYRALSDGQEDIRNAEYGIIKQHGEYLFSKSAIERNQLLQEITKLKSCDIFPHMFISDQLQYSLIQKCDLYPNSIRQFLDFHYNSTLHQCHRCFSEENVAIPSKPLKLTKQNIQKPKQEFKSSKGSLQLEPPEIIFKNFELDQLYTQKVKVKNIGSQIQIVGVHTYPKSLDLKLTYDGIQKICPGMNVIATVTFNPKSLIDLHDRISFFSRKGEYAYLKIKCFREPPKLSGFVLRSTECSELTSTNTPGPKLFSNKRQRAVNNTIDCGSCFATEYVLTSFILSNSGNRAKFFWLSEKDFYFQDVITVSTDMELNLESFWIFPTYFEMFPDDECEINIIFQPLDCGLFTQNLFLMCDNNTYQQIQLIGDSVCFNKNLITIEIPSQTKELEKTEDHCIFLGYLSYKEKAFVTFTVKNKSALCLKYSFRTAIKDPELSATEWLKIVNQTPSFLAPYSTTDFIFEFECQKDDPKGYYNTNLRFFINEVPIASLENEQKFRITTSPNTLQEIVDNVSVVDVLVMEVEVASYVEPKGELTEERAVEQEPNENIPVADLEFSEPILELGILPVGADIKRDFHIINLSPEVRKWSIAEIKYNIDSQPYLEECKGEHLSSYYGKIFPNKTRSITYNIIRKKPARYVSILVLFMEKSLDIPGNIDYIAQSICIVTYEVTELNIVIKTGRSQEPILCPMQMLYTHLPVEMRFKIKNYSLIPGCFYFLKPTGTDADKVNVEYNPQAGELRRGECITVYLKLTCYEVGILENIFLPCFIGVGQEPIRLRLLCVVDCVHVFFYMPSKNNEFRKILWPPKVIYEYDMDWSDYCMCEELSNEYEQTISTIQSQHDLEMIKKSTETLHDINNSKISIPDEIKSSTEIGSPQDLLKTLIQVDSEIFLQDCVMEVRDVVAKEPKKITIYFENVTPISAKYCIHSTNYAAKVNNIKACLGPKCNKTEDLWEPMIQNYGLVVHPEIESRYMKANEFVTVDIWIYANTWGIYSDDIIIDIDNIISFSFSLIIEVVGCPLLLPMSIGTIATYPTIRFGSLALQSDPVTKTVLIRNHSSIDTIVSWHIFYVKEEEDINTAPFNFICDTVEKSKLEFNFTDKFFGIEGADYIQIEPRKCRITSGDQLLLPITLKPQSIRSNDMQYSVRCIILGRIFTNEVDKFKSNYFYRKNNSLIIELTATMEMPRLNVEMDDNTLHMYANDVSVKRQTDFFIKCVIRNPTHSVIKAKLLCTEPFSFDNGDFEIILEPGRCKEVKIPCLVTYAKILKWAPYVYGQVEIKSFEPRSTSVNKLTTYDEFLIDEHNKILKFNRMMFLRYPGEYKMAIPLNVNIHYPNVLVKPVHIKFPYTLIGRTQKAIISIYNLTGCVILFEIYKSLSTQELVVIPPHGEIEKSTGLNHSFKSILVYFTPTECKMYQESIRVVTNIPQYYIDIPIKATASLNEKFE